MPFYFDAAAVRKGVLRLKGETQSETVTITDRTPRTLALVPGPFTWTVAWTAADGSELPESQPQNGEDVIVVPRFVRP